MPFNWRNPGYSVGLSVSHRPEQASCCGRAFHLSLNRYAAKVDANQPDIVKGLRKAGVKVWIIRRPVDLAYKWAGLFGLLEVKTEDWNGKYSSEEQREACEDFGVPVVKTLNEALYAVGVI